MGLAQRARDVRLTMEQYAAKASERAYGVYAEAGGRWQHLHPGSFGTVRKLLLGASEPPAPPPLPPYGSTVEIDGITMRVDERMSEHNIRKLMRGRHTRHERDLLDAALEDGDRLMELGGGIGMVGIFASKRLGSENVFSYEPNPEIESLTRDNYRLNDVSPTLTMAMVGRHAGKRIFYRAPRFSRSSAHVREDGAIAVDVPVLPFNEEVRRNRANVLVVDIQGGEAEFMEYADLSMIRLLLVEIHPDLLGMRKANALRRKIRGMGFDEIYKAGNSFLFFRPRSSGP